ncbi:MAG TPA: peptidoglycan-binding domain-containing protein [Solirubrobacteraceae bacterium]|nr:peptidoglycan-binding domain-containing protein [Solirubrobacteraceae bacterium]
MVLIAICGAALAPAVAGARANPLAGRAMWIWEMPAVDGGNVAQIIATAHRYGVGTLMIKSSDGTGFWSQFNAPLVAELHRAGLRVCAWQYVYGNHPVTEAYMGADAVHDGADCLLIDTESEYEGKYISAQTYIRRLRALIGYGYPLALASFPYVDYHPGFPYSVFLGPGGAQYNVPQMYWRAIGVTTDTVFAHTYSFNLPYERPIYPLGQVWGNPPAHQVVRFRALSRVYGAPGVSWWDWQEASGSDWTAVSRPAGGLPGYIPYKVMADVGQGATGDMVVWAQEHLVSAGYPIKISGVFGYHTLLDVEAFQAAHGLSADGVIGQETWTALLRYRTARVNWTARGGQHAVLATAPRHGARRAAGAGAAGAAGPTIDAPIPQSASRPARRDEIAGAGGAGRPPAGRHG